MRWLPDRTNNQPRCTATNLALHLTLDRLRLDRKIAAPRGHGLDQTDEAMSTLDPQTYAASVAEESFVDARPVTDIQRSSQLMAST